MRRFNLGIFRKGNFRLVYLLHQSQELSCRSHSIRPTCERWNSRVTLSWFERQNEIATRPAYGTKAEREVSWTKNSLDELVRCLCQYCIEFDSEVLPIESHTSPFVSGIIILTVEEIFTFLSRPCEQLK